jgi:hypothetical protein
MFTWIRRLAMPMVAVAMFICAPAAQALTVQYYTVGRFINPGGFTIDNATLAETQGALSNPFLQDVPGTSVLPAPPQKASSYAIKGDTALLFTASGLVTLSGNDFQDAMATANYGTFRVVDYKNTAANVDSFTNLQFAFDIWQVTPGSGATGTLAGTVTGSFNTPPPTGNPGQPSGLTILRFNPSKITIGVGADSVIYTVGDDGGDMQFNTKTALNPLGITELKGTATVAPLPGVAIGGLWLLGGIGSLGGLKALRRRMGAAIA